MYHHLTALCMLVRGICTLLSILIVWYSELYAQSLTPDSLSFEQFLRRVVAANPLLQSADLEQNVARAEQQSALGSFDPVLRGVYSLKEELGKDKINTLDADVELPLNALFGPKLNTGFRRSIGESSNPELRTALGGQINLGLSVPLWQGVLTDRRRTNLEKANLRPLLANIVQTQEQNNILRAAGLQYWSWSEAFEQVRIAQAVFDISLLRSNFIAARARRGEVAPLDSIEALQEIERRRGDVFRAQRAFEQAGIDLAVFLWLGNGSTTNFTPQQLTEVPRSMPLSVPFVDSLRVQAERTAALMLRPEMQRIDFSQQNLQLDLNLAYEFQKPFIETKAEWYYPLGSEMALNNYKVGLNVAVPVFFRTANAQVELFNIGLDRINLQRAQVSRLVQAEVDNAFNALQRAADRIRAADREVFYAIQMEEGERRRFTAGETSLLVVNLRERAAAEARVRLVNARADYFRAYTQYYWAVGKIGEFVR